MRMRHAAALGIGFAFLTLAANLARADFEHDPVSMGVLLTPAPGAQQSPSIASDGAGGFIVAWNDNRLNSGEYDIFAQRVDGFGRPKWGANGVTVCTVTGSQNLPVAVSDGAGGAVILWRDNRSSGTGPGFYAQRLNAAGAPLWTSGGVRAFAQPIVNYAHQAVTDGAGGIWFTALRDSSGISQVVLQHVSASGALPLGPAGLVPIAPITNPPQAMIAPDGAGGVILCWVMPGTYALAVYAKRYDAGGAPVWATGGVSAVLNSYTNLQLAHICADGQGGVFLAASSGANVQVQHVGSQHEQLWGDGGIVAAVTARSAPVRIAADGLGGAMVAWADNRRSASDVLYAQRVASSGSPAWGAGGIPLTTTSPLGQSIEQILPDGQGGAMFTWTDWRTAGAVGVYTQRVSAAGALLWMPDGTPLATPSWNCAHVAALPDGEGGQFLAWDVGSPLGYFDFDIAAQRQDRYGLLGANAPALTSVRDVLGDQGGRVKVSWNAAWLDADSRFGVSKYRVWRSVASRLALTGAARPTTANSDEAAAMGWWLADANATDYAWELAGEQPAALLPAYSFVAATGGDSTGAGTPRTAFRVEALSSDAIDARHWWSQADSGYSVDNIPPAAPASFAGTYAAGATSLSWLANSDADLAGYRLYRGDTPGFTPSPATLVANLAALQYADASGASHVYKLTAVDVHGNESPAAMVIPSGTADAERADLAFALAAPAPNPARGATTLRWTLPRTSAVRLTLTDVSGRRIRTLEEGERTAGEHATALALVDDAGRALAPGIYLVRMEAEGRERVRRVVAMR